MDGNDRATVLMAEEAALGRLALNYARAVDGHDVDLFLSLFTEDATLETPVNAWAGHEQLRNIPVRVGTLYQSTLHTVRNQYFAVDGDRATGETYCIAYHLFRPEDGQQKRADWAIRYQDRFVRSKGAWKFASRRLVVDWIQTTVQTVGS